MSEQDFVNCMNHLSLNPVRKQEITEQIGTMPKQKSQRRFLKRGLALAVGIAVCFGVGAFLAINVFMPMKGGGKGVPAVKICMAAIGDKLYFVYRGKLNIYDSATHTITFTATVPEHESTGNYYDNLGTPWESIFIKNNDVYYCDSSRFYLFNTETQIMSLLFTGDNYTTLFGTDDSNLYFISRINGYVSSRLCSYSLRDRKVTVLNDNINNAVPIMFDNYIYYTENDAGSSLHCLNLSNQSDTVIASVGIGKLIDCNNSLIVINENDSNWLYKIEGKKLTNITPSGAFKINILRGSSFAAYDNALYYWNEDVGNDLDLCKYDLTSTEVERINVSHCGDLCAGNNCVYVYEYSSNPLICYNILTGKEYSIPLDNQ